MAKANMNENMPAGHSAGFKDPSGLLSADEMTGPLPDQGWTATGSIPGIDAAAGLPINSAAGSQVDFSGKSAPGEPFTGTDMSGQGDQGLPMAVLMSCDEPMGPTTGAGLRSASDEMVKFGK